MRPERTASGTLTAPFPAPARAGDVKAISSEQAAQTRAKLRNDFGVVIAVDGHRTVSALTLSKVRAYLVKGRSTTPARPGPVQPRLEGHRRPPLPDEMGVGLAPARRRLPGRPDGD